MTNEQIFSSVVQKIRIIAIAAAFFGICKAFALSQPIDISVHDSHISEAQENDRNRQSFEATIRGESNNPSDFERAERYVRDNFARKPNEHAKLLNRLWLLKYSKLWGSNEQDWYESYCRTFE